MYKTETLFLKDRQNSQDNFTRHIPVLGSLEPQFRVKKKIQSKEINSGVGVKFSGQSSSKTTGAAGNFAAGYMRAFGFWHSKAFVIEQGLLFVQQAPLEDGNHSKGKGERRTLRSHLRANINSHVW